MVLANIISIIMIIISLIPNIYNRGLWDANWNRVTSQVVRLLVASEAIIVLLVFFAIALRNSYHLKWAIINKGLFNYFVCISVIMLVIMIGLLMKSPIWAFVDKKTSKFGYIFLILISGGLMFAINTEYFTVGAPERIYDPLQ